MNASSLMSALKCTELILMFIQTSFFTPLDGLVINSLQLFDGIVSVNLGSRKVGMPKKFLNSIQFSALLSKWVANVCRKRAGDLLKSGHLRQVLRNGTVNKTRIGLFTTIGNKKPMIIMLPNDR